MRAGGEPTRPASKSHVGPVGLPCRPEGLLPTQDWAQVGPMLKPPPSTGQDATQSAINC